MSLLRGLRKIPLSLPDHIAAVRTFSAANFGRQLNSAWIWRLGPTTTSGSYVTLHTFRVNFRTFSASSGLLSANEFGELCEETLDSLADYLEELVESVPAFKNGDVTYSDGVITASLGNDFGTYVINRQTPNQQIWLSSPKSGPKRYDYIGGLWVYKHDNSTLHDLLDRELGLLIDLPVEFSTRCAYGKKE